MKNTVLIPSGHKKYHFPFITSSENTCQCKNSVIGLLDYKEIICLNISQKYWQNEIETYTFYINQYYQNRGLPPVNSVEINNNIQWFNHCAECGKKVCNSISGNNIA